MELISVASAKAVWLVNTTDLNPKGLRILPQLTEALIEEYDFDEPAEDSSQPPNSIKLKNGEFQKGDDVFRVALEIYDDGFVAESAQSTALTEDFLIDALEWAKTNFAINFDPSLLMKKIYFSEVVVRFSSPLAPASKLFAEFADLLNESVSAPGADGFMLSALSFASRVHSVGNSPKAITIERRANTAPDANIFYCKAPLMTDEFLNLLVRFDELLAKA